MRLILFLVVFASEIIFAQQLPVRIEEPDEEELSDGYSGYQVRYKVFVGEKLFTTFLYRPDALEKPVLFPVYSPQDVVVTRGYPLEPRPGERVDHPHHVGIWFNYGSVNGLDFWNNSFAIPQAEKSNYGRITLEEHLIVSSGKKQGILEFANYWKDQRGLIHLQEDVRFTFSGTKDVWIIDRITRLTCGPSMDSVAFGDNKEGLLAIRMDRAFEEPISEPEVFTDAAGKPSDVAVLNNDGVNGIYRNSNGLTRGEVWGKRANWVALTANKGDKKITVAMVDHPENFGYPAHWHARGYGLFSVNNFGSKVYVPSDKDQRFVLRAGQVIQLRHRIIIGDAGKMTNAFLDRQFDSLAKERGEFAGFRP